MTKQQSSQLTKSTNAAQNTYLICLIYRSHQKSAANAWDDVLLIMLPGEHESCSLGCCCIGQQWLFVHITWRM